MKNNETKKQLARWIDLYFAENDDVVLLVFDDFEDDFPGHFADYLMERGVTVSFSNVLKEDKNGSKS